MQRFIKAKRNLKPKNNEILNIGKNNSIKYYPYSEE